jgi:N-acetylglucosaminyldiphosphoundecaprenol N-acetyl-beta-D-mannosaminyltransferase
MLKTNTTNSFSEIDDSSAVTGEVSGDDASDRAPIHAVLDYLEKGERNFLTPAALTEMAHRPTSAEIAAALTLAPGVSVERPALDRERPAATANSPQKNSRVDHGAPRTGAHGGHRMQRPFALVPTLSKPSPLFLKAPARVPLMGVRIDCVTERQVTAHVISSIRAGVGGWIATPNVQHLRVISEQPELLRLVNEANFRVADGMPLLWASRLQGTPLPERITGAGLTLSLAAAAAKAGSSIFLLGGDPGDAEAAATVLKRLNPDLKIAGVSCPAPGFERDPLQMAEIGNTLRSAKADLVYSCFGFPKQEMVIRALREYLPSAWFLGLGGSLAIVSGRTRRAPGWIQGIGMEWAWRLGLEPRRLFHRYIVKDLPFFFRLLGNAIVQH